MLPFITTRFMWHSFFRLCFFFFTEFGITGFPAVGNLGQELADVFYFRVGPNLDCGYSGDLRLRVWNFSGLKVCCQCGVRDSQPFGCFACRMVTHSTQTVRDRWLVVKQKCIGAEKKRIK